MMIYSFPQLVFLGNKKSKHGLFFFVQNIYYGSLFFK